MTNVLRCSHFSLNKHTNKCETEFSATIKKMKRTNGRATKIAAAIIMIIKREKRNKRAEGSARDVITTNSWTQNSHFISATIQPGSGMVLPEAITKSSPVKRNPDKLDFVTTDASSKYPPPIHSNVPRMLRSKTTNCCQSNIGCPETSLEPLANVSSSCKHTHSHIAYTHYYTDGRDPGRGDDGPPPHSLTNRSFSRISHFAYRSLGRSHNHHTMPLRIHFIHFANTHIQVLRHRHPNLYTRL